MIKLVDEFQMKISTVVPDGLHEGKISNVHTRKTEKAGETYAYVNIEIETTDISDTNSNPIILNLSAPANLTRTPEGQPNSKFAKILVSLGYDIEKMESITIDGLLKDLKGKKVSFLTVNETSERGSFATVIEKSLKLV